MSFGRKAYDGNVARRNPGITKRGNSFNSESKTNKYASGKRSVRNNESLENLDHFNDEAGRDRYLITYADLITLLLGLFIILYAISNIDLNKYQKVVGAMGDIFGENGRMIKVEGMPDPISIDAIQKLKSDVHSLVSELNYDDFITVAEDDRGVIIRIQEDILFPPGLSELSKSSKEVLFSIANIIRNLPNDIRIEGNTDNVPISTKNYPSNWHLSSARASNTVYYFIKECGLDPQKLSIVGNADTNPVADNNSAKGRAKNRRVDIVIIK